jgi:hypothetical protein
VSIHAGSRHLDWSSPVVVVVTESKGEFLNSLFGETGIIEGTVEVSWQDTSLSGVLGNQEEVKLSVGIIVLNKLLVNDASRGRIVIGSILTFNKESLGDSLVDNDDSDLRFLSSSIVHFTNSLSDLGYFLGKYLLSHGITNSISEENEVFRESLVSISSLERFHSHLQSFTEFLSDNLLASLLDDSLGIVLGHSRID